MVSKIGFASFEDMQARTIAVASGELCVEPGAPKLWFTSPESLARLLSSGDHAC